MGFLDFLFGSPKRRKKAAKKKPKTSKKTSEKKVKGLRNFVIFDGDTDTKLAEVSAKSETQAFKFWANNHKTEAETARIVSKKRWDSYT